LQRAIGDSGDAAPSTPVQARRNHRR
jgi:hypothetical protein